MTAITKPLLDVWRTRAALWKEARKLWAESDRLRDDTPKDLMFPAWRIWRAEQDRLRDAGYRAAFKGTTLWNEAVIAEFGTGAMKWSGDACTLANGDVYTPEDAA